MMSFAAKCLAWALFFPSIINAQSANVTLTPAATGFESDVTAFYYSSPPSLVANDGSADNGGFRVFSVGNSTPYEQKSRQKTGRSKFATPVYDVGGRDVLVNIPAPDSIMRVFDAATVQEIEGARKKVLGDWSTMCSWRSTQSGESYLFMFGKKMVVQLWIGETQDGDIQLLEVQQFPIPIEGETCTVFSNGQVYFSGDDLPLYSFQAQESTSAPQITTVSEDLEVGGLATYHSDSDYLLVAHDEVIDFYDASFTQVGTIALSGITDLSIEGGLSVLQSATSNFPSGAAAFAFEGEDETGVAIGSLEDVFSALGVQSNTEYSPKVSSCGNCTSPISSDCGYGGFSQENGTCECFVGFSGDECGQITCENDCSGHGQCDGPHTCTCESGWEGPDCSFVAVQPKYETDANGGDGDDPAIWIHPSDSTQSKIITTTKSEAGEGFGVFDLKGNLLQHVSADEPNNVDIIYSLTVGDRQVDLAFAACRGDNTLCFFEINSTGLLSPIPGGVQSTPEDYEVYGSCNYHSAQTNKHYLFVNNKEAQYLQYELTATANGTLETTLVRDFQAGSGGQVEGCVADDATGYLFLGEEPTGIWRYDAEPTSNANSSALQIAQVGDASNLSADVEGLTLVPARNSSDGYLIVSSQGISAFLVYQRAPPHEYVMTFTVVDNEERGVDHVSNTDGVAAVGNRLGEEFPYGLVVMHDDANELAEGGTADAASFKLVSLRDVLGEERVMGLGY